MARLIDGMDNDTIRANIKVHSVHQEGIPNADGGIDQEWMIDYSPGTDASLGRILAKVRDVSPETNANGRQMRTNDPHSAIGMMQRRRWEAMKPYIDAAQQGQEIPQQGHALAVWPGLDQRRAEIMRQYGIRTVEEMISMPESILITIQSKVPDIRHYMRQGRQFLDAQESSAAAAAINERDKVIETLKLANADMGEQMSEMRSMMERILTAQASQTEPSEDAPKRRRRTREEIDAAADDVTA
mgnify:CR=1 FL=1